MWGEDWKVGGRLGEVSSKISDKALLHYIKGLYYFILQPHPHSAIAPPLETKLIDIQRIVATRNGHQQIDLNVL